MTALTHSTTTPSNTTAISNLPFFSSNITTSLSNDLLSKKLIENYPQEHDPKENFINTLHFKKTIDSNYQIILENIKTQFPNLDIEEIKPIVDILIKPRLINIYADQERTCVVAVAIFSWIELFRYLKQNAPDITGIDLFGSRLPSLLPQTIQKVAQKLAKNDQYQLPSTLLNRFLGIPADTDYEISLPLSTPERFEDFKNIFADFITQKACLNNSNIAFDIMKNYVTEYSFFKRNVPKAAYANMFALFSLKEADTQEISEFVVSQKQNEFALLQDDFTLPLDAIIDEFPEEIFTNIQQSSSAIQKLLHIEKEKIFKKIQGNAFKIPEIKNTQNKLWQVAFDLLVGHLSLPESPTITNQRLLRVLLKYSIGKCAIDKSLEFFTIGKLKTTVDNWPGNQCSLPRNLQAKLTDLVTDPFKDTDENKVAAIIAYELERYFHTHSLGFNALISMLWHCSMMLQREGLEDAIIPLWDDMHSCIDNLRSKKVRTDSNRFSLWETISQVMLEADTPKDFKNLQNLLQQNAFLSRIPLDVALTLDQGVLSFKISEDNYSLSLPACQPKFPNSTKLFPAFEPLMMPQLTESQITSYLASQVVGKGSFQSKMTALEILHSSTNESMQEAWKIIKANMLDLIKQTKDPKEVLLLMKTALKCHLKREQDCDALFSSSTKNTSPYLIWAHILLNISDGRKGDADITTAYNLWAKHREKDPALRDFPFELAMIKKIASHKPHLAMSLFYSLEETGYQANEQTEVFTWLLPILKDSNFEEETFSSSAEKTSPYLLQAHIQLNLGDGQKTDDITNAYNLWTRHREKDPTVRDFSFEWAMIKKMAFYMPHLAIPLFCSLQETGYQNNEQTEIFDWLLPLLQDNSSEQEKFCSLIPVETQFSFINFVLEKCSDRNIDFNFLIKLRDALSNTCEQETVKSIDQKLTKLALEKINNIDITTLTHICELATKSQWLPEARTFILKLIKNKDIDTAILTDRIADYFCSLQETGHQNNEQTEIFDWLLSILQDNNSEQEKFCSLIPVETQLSFINFVLEKLSDRNIDFNFLIKLRDTLSNTCEPETVKSIDQKLAKLAIERIDNVDITTLTHICELATESQLLPEAETIILKLIKNKNIDNTILANRIAHYFRKVNHENDVKKLLIHNVEKLLFHSPKEAMAGLLHIQQLKNANTSSETTKTALRIYLQIFHESKNSINLDCTPCLPIVQEILNEKAKLADALKKSIQNSHQELLDAALKQSETHSTDFCSLFFDFLKKQISTGITKDHILKIIQYLDNEEIGKKFLPYEQQFIKIHPPLAHLDSLKNIHKLQFKENVISYFCNPTKNALKNLCISIKQKNYDIQEVLADSSFWTEFKGEEIQKMVDAVAQNIYENRTFLRSTTEPEETTKMIHLAFKIWKGFQNTFYKELPNFRKDYTHNDLLMQVLNGFHDETSLPTEFVCSSLNLELLQDKNFLRSQSAAITEMNENQYFLYFLAFAQAFIQKLAENESTQHDIGYRFLQQLVQKIPFKCSVKLAQTFCFESDEFISEIGSTSALIIIEELFRNPLSKEEKEEEELSQVGSKILSKLLWKYPNQLNSRLLHLLSTMREFINYDCASRFLAFIMLQTEDFPEDILHSFFKIEQPEVNLADRYFELFRNVSSIIPQTPNILIRYIKSLQWINKLIIKQELAVKQINLFIKEVIDLAFADLPDSSFNKPGQDVYEEYLEIIRDILNDPQLEGTAYRGTTCLALGLPYTHQSWIHQERSGIHSYMNLEKINYVIDSEINKLLGMALTPADSSNSCGYAKFKQIAAMLQNGFNDFFKNRYLQYLKFVNQLTQIAVTYADHKVFFEIMNTTILYLYCADDPALTLEDKNARAAALFEWFKKLPSACSLKNNVYLRENYSKYLGILYQLTAVAVFYADKNSFFEKMNAIILALYCADDLTLTPEDINAREAALLEWLKDLSSACNLENNTYLKENYSKYLSIVNQLTLVAKFYIRKKSFFKKLNTIILDLYCTDHPALTPENRNARGAAIFEWCMQLGTMNHPSADLASAYILEETAKRNISVLMTL